MSDCGFGLERYRRQLGLWGLDGQEMLESSTVAVVGLGGLGGVVSLYLAGAGVGRLILVDGDVVEPHNLNRQLLYDEASVGLPKAVIAARRVREFNSCVEVVPVQERLTPDNVHRILGGVDLIVDALDNWEARLVLDEYARETGTPLVHGAVERFYGQVLFTIPGETACLSCIAPRGGRGRCVQVAGPAVGVVASLEATLAVRFLAGLPVEAGTLYVVDAADGGIEKIPLAPGCGCGDGKVGRL